MVRGSSSSSNRSGSSSRSSSSSSSNSSSSSSSIELCPGSGLGSYECLGHQRAGVWVSARGGRLGWGGVEWAGLGH